MVKAGWEHPRQECRHSPWNGGCVDAKRNGGFCYKPLLDQSYADAVAQAESDGFDGIGEPSDYRPDWTQAEMTHYQLYENVSEGTPVSPAFATEDELINYLVEYGDFWGSYRGEPNRYSREAAESAVRGGYTPSFAVVNGKIMQPHNMELPKNDH